MLKRPLTIVGAAALYGFAIGSVHSAWLARWDLVKFPLFLLLTSQLCALAYYVFARVIAGRLSFGEVWDLSMATYRDVAVLLASLSPVAFFLARTVVQPDAGSLGEYPFFLGLNVGFIALCGVVALVRQTLRLLRRHRLRLARAMTVTVVWLALSLFAGAQCAWFFRPFFGPSTIAHPPVIEGWGEDYRGARSFYEAVYHLLDPPPLPADYRSRTGQRWLRR